VRLTIIGCSGSFPGPESPASCYLVEAPYDGRTFRLLLDLGSGALGALQRHVDLDEIDAIALSHLHPDHCIDLCGYYVVRKYHPTGPRPQLPVYGPDGAGERMARAYDLPDAHAMDEQFDFVTYPEASFGVGPFTLDVARVDHPVPAYAIRVTHDGRSLVYSGDTGQCSKLEELAKGSDVLLCEASFMEGVPNPPGLHLTGREAAETAERAGVGRLLLTHVPPWHDPQSVLAEALPHYGGPAQLVSPSASYDI
jgi:ribonuclease BN (tRNA processing enzyme)